MIDAKEMRLNNLVRFTCDGDIDKVDGIGKDYVTLENYGGEWSVEIEPIPLSPELLIKCGFWKADGYNFDLGDLILHDMFDGNDNDCEAYLKAGIATIYIKNIKYLHELQNLYWCLTQKELEVNL